VRHRLTIFFLAALAVWPAAAEARDVCGPGAKTLAQSAESRVYVRQGKVLACHRSRAVTYRLGYRANVIDAQVAGRYASVRGRTANGQTLRVFDLRTGRAKGTLLRVRRVRLSKLDSTGTSAFAAIGADGLGVVGVSSGWKRGKLARIDDIGLRGTTFVYRVGTQVIATQIKDVLDRRATDGTLLQIGGVRLDVKRGKLRARSGNGPGMSIDGQATGWRCTSQTDCAGWGTIQVVGSRVVVPDTSLGGNGTLVTAYDLLAGRSTKPCAGDARSIVVTDTAKVACGQWAPDGERQIVIEGVVLDSGPGVYIYSLTRRGDQLVWVNGGVEKTAPIPG
jgi:hypothetical protein